MNLQGDFEGAFLASIFQLLHDDQKTGVLHVTCHSRECKVFFREGTIIYAQSSAKGVRLGALLRRDGIISHEELQKCLLTARKKRLAMGRILVDEGYVSLDVLKEYNRKQVEEILYGVLLWEKGTFLYQDRDLRLEGMVVTRLNPMQLILEASRRIDEMNEHPAGEPDDAPNQSLDLEFVITVYLDLIRIITKTVTAELGPKAGPLMTRVRMSLPPLQAELMGHFEGRRPETVNPGAFNRILRDITGDTADRGPFLIDSFNKYSYRLLSRLIPSVNQRVVYDTVQEMDQILGDLRNHPGNRTEKERIIADFGKILQDIITQLPIRSPGAKKEESTGLLSFLKKG